MIDTDCKAACVADGELCQWFYVCERGAGNV
ncbi:MAG: hypothetical protein H6Q73_895 [Firmicutes bacterium]|nr:hypothetical protein [Bacillota bacterium]